MKFCLCVTGFTGAGKTTLVRRLGLMGWRTCHTGELFRKHIAVIPEDEDPVAPEFADDLIHKALMRLAEDVASSPGLQLMAVECVPRAVRSVSWIEEIQRLGFTVHVLVLAARQKIREQRVESRDLHDANRLDIDRRKILAEQMSDVFFDIRTELQERGIAWSYLETDGWQYAMDDDVQPFALDRMMSCALNFYGEKVDYAKQPDVPRMVERTIDELQEVLGAWHHTSQTPERASNQVITELVDALWFLLGAFRAAGVDSGRELVQHYLAKAAINQHRLDSGTHMDTDG